MRQRAIVEQRAFPAAPPRSRMQLVNRHWRIQRVMPGTLPHPGRILPVVIQLPDDGSRLRRRLGAKSEGIRLVHRIGGMPGNEAELIALAGPGGRHPTFPDSGAGMKLGEWMGGGIPVIEVTDHRHRSRVGGPDREMHPVLPQLRPQFSVQPAMASLGKQMEIEIAEQAVGVLCCHGSVRTWLRAQRRRAACHSYLDWPQSIRPQGTSPREWPYCGNRVAATNGESAGQIRKGPASRRLS